MEIAAQLLAGAPNRRGDDGEVIFASRPAGLSRLRALFVAARFQGCGETMSDRP